LHRYTKWLGLRRNEYNHVATAKSESFAAQTDSQWEPKGRAIDSQLGSELPGENGVFEAPDQLKGPQNVVPTGLGMEGDIGRMRRKPGMVEMEGERRCV
jgi:hypothetical protein